MTKNNHKVRTFDSSAAAVAFPLGGIGTGNVSLGARGDLRDWEIFNRPAKGSVWPNTFFAIRTQVAAEEPVGRVLEGPIQPPYTLSHGYHPAHNAGLPRFANTTFRGEYPLATIDFEDDALPVQVELEAYTPLVPLNPDDSGLPCAILTYTVHNRTDVPVKMTLAGSLINPVGGLRQDKFGNIDANKLGQTVNKVLQAKEFQGLFLAAEGIDKNDLHYGNLSLVTDHPNITVKPAWLRGAWWDFLREFWDDFMEDGLFNDLEYSTPPEDNKPDTGSLGVVDTLAPGETKSYRFILTWYFPNRPNGWKSPANLTLDVDELDPSDVTRNHYARRLNSAWDVARYVVDNFLRLETETYNFHQALFSSTSPAYIIDAISANIVPLRSNTCFWLEDGRFYGWEGCFDTAGCCTGTCTHVWSYVYTIAYLFPSLEREMRQIEFNVETEDDGYMYFRTHQTFGEEFLWQWGDHKPEPAVDGQMGCIIRAYREWQLSGDKDWLQSIWPSIKKSIAFAAARWDINGDGLLDGRQHNTYDIEFFGPNPLCGIYYLAALRAVEEMAGVMQEPALARQMRNIFERGSRNLDEQLWNGEYYIQKTDNVDEHYYQHGVGCLSDQLLGQLHACILGLGDLLPANHIKTAVKSIFDYNFRTDFSEHVNCQRTYILNDEAGLTMCSWPNGGQPRYPFVYSDEVWTSIEYHVAALLIYEGWLAEGLKLVETARARYDGYRRNPWNEVECGHHYARTMTSWALLLALSGQQGDLGRGELSFEPIMAASTEENYFQTFWSNGKAWGTYSQQLDKATGQWQTSLNILGGDLSSVRVKANGQIIQPTWT